MAESFVPLLPRLPPWVPPVRLDPTGVAGPTRGQARGRAWRRTSRGWFVPAEVDGSRPEQRIVEQAARIGSAGAVTGWAALRLAGAAYFDGLDPGGARRPVPLVDPSRQLRSDPGAVVSRAGLDLDERVVIRGVPAARVARALLDEVALLGELRAAVVAVDMSLAAELTSPERLRRYAASRRGARGVGLLGRALRLADEGSRSPQESRLRLVWMLDAGLPRPLCNRTVFDRAGRPLGTPDLLDPEAGVVGEFDGADHLVRSRRFRDLGREQRFRDHGLECFTAVGGDLHAVPALVARMRGARSRALWLPPADRAWTITPPPSPEDDPEVDLDLEDRLRLRELAARWHESA